MSIDSLKGIQPGDLFLDTENRGYPGDVWVVESMCELPTITLRNLMTGQKECGAVGSSNVAGFVRARVVAEDEFQMTYQRANEMTSRVGGLTTQLAKIRAQRGEE